MTIEEALSAIKNAVYGKDVRQAMHDGILQAEGGAGTVAKKAEASAKDSAESAKKAAESSKKSEFASKAIEGKADQAVTIAKSANSKSDSTQLQLDEIVINGDSSVEAAQARVDIENIAHDTLKDRLDKEQQEVNAQLAQTEKQVGKNPYEYGAIGDGVQDDTEYIQAMMDAILEISNRFSGHVYTGFSQPVKFPVGDYLISDTIFISKTYPNIDFSGSRFRPHPLSANDFFAFDFDGIWNGGFKNIVLDGFNKNFNLYNDNIDSGHITIENVSIYGGAIGFKIECQSSKVTLNKFKSNNVKQPIVSIRCDKLTWDSGWWDAGVLDEEYQGMIELNNSSQFVINDVLYVPRVQKFEARKVFIVKLNSGSVTFVNNLFGGEPGQTPLVGVFAGSSSGRPNAVIIKDTLAYTTGSAMVELYNIPNYIEISGLRGSYEETSQVMAIRFNDDFMTLEEAVEQSSNASKIIFDKGYADYSMSSVQVNGLIRYLRGPNNEMYGKVKATNKVGGEVLFDSKRNSVNSYNFRRGAVFKINISNRKNVNVNHYSEYIVQSNYVGDNLTFLPVVEGNATSAPRLLNDNGVLKIITNGAVAENEFYYKLSIADVPINPTTV